jgi:hypothetical protein
MGTTQAFYTVKNKGFSISELNEKVNSLAMQGKAKTDQVFKRLEQSMGHDIFKQATDKYNETRAFFDDIFGWNRQAKTNSTVIAYNETKSWLPFYEETLCDSNIASINDLRRLNDLFDAPILTFSLFDSDVLFISYIDQKHNILFNYAKLPFEGYGEYDSSVFSTDFPEFLKDYCNDHNYQKLQDIWFLEKMFCAEDILYDICDLLNIDTMFDAEDIPEDYEPIIAKQPEVP